MPLKDSIKRSSLNRLEHLVAGSVVFYQKENIAKTTNFTDYE